MDRVPKKKKSDFQVYKWNSKFCTYNILFEFASSKISLLARKIVLSSFIHLQDPSLNFYKAIAFSYEMNGTNLLYVLANAIYLIRRNYSFIYTGYSFLLDDFVVEKKVILSINSLEPFFMALIILKMMSLSKFRRLGSHLSSTFDCRFFCSFI